MFDKLMLVVCALLSLSCTYIGASNLAEDSGLLFLFLVYVGGIFSMATVCLIGE